jgi:Spy/CpxP family protein refolding chaperone
MKNRNATIPAILLIAGLLTTGSALAQSPNRDGPWHDGGHYGGPPSAEQQLARLSEQLQLTDQQSLQLLEVLLGREEQHQALRARMLEEMQPELCALMQETETDILAILTPEQGEQFLQLSSDRRSRAKNHHGRGAALAECEGSAG